jgi:hypothetical protein
VFNLLNSYQKSCFIAFSSGQNEMIALNYSIVKRVFIVIALLP